MQHAHAGAARWATAWPCRLQKPTQAGVPPQATHIWHNAVEESATVPAGSVGCRVQHYVRSTQHTAHSTQHTATTHNTTHSPFTRCHIASQCSLVCFSGHVHRRTNPEPIHAMLALLELLVASSNNAVERGNPVWWDAFCTRQAYVCTLQPCEQRTVLRHSHTKVRLGAVTQSWCAVCPAAPGRPTHSKQA
jgi:hypothetical protein